ncbi:NAD(P)H-binding protein [Streptomyces sp. NPDC020141]|uniref:NAD(P)H-binding protein n=1 Tax=Streptomyces sp. NPDC020141 TaxID=3365065 RepID=UPI0037A1DF7F
MTSTHTSTPSAPSSSVLVLGGTGKTGRRVAAALSRLGITPKVASRSAPVRFDWADEGSWDPALAGVGAVYVVDSQGPAAPAEVRAFAAAAKARGVRRLVLLSARVWEELDDGSGEVFATERAVRESGLDWTILRPAWFNQNFTEEPWYSAPLAEGELRLPAGDGRERFVDLDDLAEVAAAALTQDGHSGRVYTLSGPDALSFHDVAEALSTASGHKVAYTPVTREQYIEEQLARGYAPDFAELMADLFLHIGANGSAAPSDGVRQALGREPRAFGEYVRRTDFSSLGAARG